MSKFRLKHYRRVTRQFPVCSELAMASTALLTIKPNQTKPNRLVELIERWARIELLNETEQ